MSTSILLRSRILTYSVGNDLFFSGHTALAVYGAIQLASLHIPR